MTTAPIVLVPGVLASASLGVATRSPPPCGPTATMSTAVTLPGLESADADDPRSPCPTTSTRSARRCAAAGAASRARRPQRNRVRRLRRTSDRLADRDSRAMRLCRLRPWDRSDGPRLRGCRAAPASAGEARRGREPRRAQRGAARDLPQAGGSATWRRHAQGSGARRTMRVATFRARSSAPGSRPSRSRPMPRSTTRPGWPASPSSVTSPGSTCQRVTGRCGRDHRSSPGSSATSRRLTPPASRRTHAEAPLID